MLRMVAKAIGDTNRFAALKPNRVKNEIDGNITREGGNLNAVLEGYKARLMPTAGSQVRSSTYHHDIHLLTLDPRP